MREGFLGLHMVMKQFAEKARGKFIHMKLMLESNASVCSTQLYVNHGVAMIIIIRAELEHCALVKRMAWRLSSTEYGMIQV